MQSPITQPTSEVSRHGCNMISWILPLMAECGIRFDIPSAWGVVTKGTIGISSLFDSWVKFHPHRQRLLCHGLVALEQLLSPDCGILLSWKELRCLIPSLSFAVPQWFLEIESILGIGAQQMHRRIITLPPPLSIPAGPNPFCNSLLSYQPIVAKVGSFVAVFPASFMDDGGYFLAKLVGWEEGIGADPVKYHLQHWRMVEVHDDPEGILHDEGYYVQCRGDCDAPQVCEACDLSCCWWESSGIADLSFGVWVGQLQQVNFIGDTITTQEFVCMDLVPAELELLWQQLPDEAEGASSEQALVLASACSEQSVQAQAIHFGVGVDNSGLSLPQVPMTLVTGADCLSVYSDGSLQGARSKVCCSGAGVAVLEGGESLWEVGVCIDGWLSSTKAELYACALAMIMLPQHWPLKIYTDSQGLISGFQSFVTGAHLQPFRCLLRTRFYREWATLRQIVSHRLSPVQLVKVAAHTGNFGNDLADHIAKQAAVSGKVWSLPFCDLTDIWFLPTHGRDSPV